MSAVDEGSAHLPDHGCMALEERGKRQLRADAIALRVCFRKSIEELAVALADEAAVPAQGLDILERVSASSHVWGWRGAIEQIQFEVIAVRLISIVINGRRG